jgi:multidrug efflux pump
MNLSQPFIKRPVATTLLAIGLAMAGMIAFYLLPVASLPQIDFPTISVQAAYPGASPEVMGTSIAAPLERQLGRIAGVTQMTSASTLGSTNINIQFDLSRNIDGAARDVQAAINAARSQLPPDIPTNPTYRKVNPADAPIIVIALTSYSYSTGQLYDIASTLLQQKLSQVDGVGQVNVVGGSLPGVRVELNPRALNSYGIGLEDVRNAIAAANVNQPKGQFINNETVSSINTNDQLFKAFQYKPLIIAYRNHAPVRLSDVADVNDSVENIRTAGLSLDTHYSSQAKPAVLLVIFKQPGANVIETVDRIKQMMPQLHSYIPNAVNMTIAVDRTTTIRASLRDVEATLIIAIILVILVIYFFLGSARAALIPSVTVPLALLGTFGVMYLLHYTLDNLSLMALTISTGFVVDDAVVVLENTERHIEAGLKPMEAALQGAKEVGFTVLSMSISLIAVFIPILFMQGLVGRLFREFAITLSSAIIISLCLSLTITPMLCSRLLLATSHQKDKNNFFKRNMNKLRDSYKNSLSWGLSHARLMQLLTIGAIVLSILLFILIPKGFFPQQDTGRITASIQARQDISFQAMKQKLFNYVEIVGKDPAVQHVVGFVGGGPGTNTTNSGSLFIALKPLSVRKISADDVINRLRNKLAVIPGASLYMQAAQDLVIGGRLGNAQYQYTLYSDDLQDLNYWAPQVLAKMSQLSGIIDVNSDQLNNGLQEYITYNRDTASQLGIDAQLADNTLYDAFGQRQISVMYTLLNQYHVVMEVAPSFLQNPQSLKNIYVLSSNNKEVPLSGFASFAPLSTLLAVNHTNQFPSATLSFNLLSGVSIGEAVNNINNAVEPMHLPPTIHGIFQGSAQAFQASLASEPYLIVVALLTVYIVLGILYESTIHPLTILSTLPSAGAGALLALLITHTELSIIAFIGIILLIGIVKKNAIMMIDFALEAKRIEKKSSRNAIYQAAILRFRPIMMTTMAAMLGAFPLAFGWGVGSEMRRPLGIAIIGGLLVSQLLTLYTTPVMYLTMERVGNWGQKKWAGVTSLIKPPSKQSNFHDNLLG